MAANRDPGGTPAPGAYTARQRALLARYVSNLDGDVYVIGNLPEEVIAVIFAYVSRSPRSFRDNLLRLLEDGTLELPGAKGLEAQPGLEMAAERARRFHEKWVVGYGHASVAELAKAAVGIERISRLASAQLETANPWLSFIEYSQRYQRPRRGAYVVPPELAAAGDPQLLEAFHQLQACTFDAYEELLAGLVPFLEEVEPRQPGEGETARRARLERLAFEDARYALTLAVQTNLGMVGNARALRDMLVRLLSDPYQETTRLAEAIRREVTRVLPTLVRYAEPSSFLQESDQELATAVASLRSGREVVGAATDASVRLLDWTGRQPELPEAVWAAAGTGAEALGSAKAGTAAGGAREAFPAAPADSGPPVPPVTTPDEQRALDVLLGAWLTQYGGVGWPESDELLRGLSPGEKVRWFARGVGSLGRHDPPPDALKLVRYRVLFNVSEANWHQLLRHSRRIHFVPQAPGIDQGIVVPPRVRAAGLSAVLIRAVDAAERLYRRLQRAGLPQAAHYVVTNAHRRRVWAELDLWQLYHLIRLRGKPEAQWDIRQTIHQLARQVMEVHPNLIGQVPVLMEVLTPPAQEAPPTRGRRP